MKLFSVSDVLSATTGRLVSDRHMEGIYEILNFLTGDNLFTHQLPRAMNECKPWLRSQFPALMEDSPGMPGRLADMDRRIKAVLTGVRTGAVLPAGRGRVREPVAADLRAFRILCRRSEVYAFASVAPRVGVSRYFLTSVSLR